MRTCQNGRSILLSFVALAAFAAGACAKSPAAALPRPAPAFTLQGTQGTVALDSLRGHVVLLDFWASWCGPCQRSFPFLDSLAAKYGSSGLTVVGVNLDKKEVAAAAFLDLHAVRFPIAFDPEGDVADAYGVRVMPTSFLIDRSGAIVSIHAGFDERRGRALESAVRALCAQ